MIAVPSVALTVSPTRLVVAAGETGAIQVTNRGGSAAVIVAQPAALAVGLRGQPMVGRTRPFVVVRPRQVTVPPRGTATLTVSAATAKPEPGDHPSLVLVSSRGSRRDVGVDVRIGVVVLLRGAGRIVRHLVPLALRARGPDLELSLRNEGNVSERLTTASLRVRLLPRGRARVEPRELLPHTRGLVRLHPGPRSPFAAIVRVRGQTFRLKVAGRR